MKVKMCATAHSIAGYASEFEHEWTLSEIPKTGDQIRWKDDDGKVIEGLITEKEWVLGDESEGDEPNGEDYLWIGIDVLSVDYEDLPNNEVSPQARAWRNERALA